MRAELSSRTILRLVLVSSGSPLVHVGAGVSLGEVLEVLKLRTLRGTYAIIPSHSIKGVLRRVAELVAKSSVSGGDLEAALLRAHCELEGEGIRHICSSSSDISLIEGYVERVLSNEELASKFIPRDSLEEIRSKLRDKGVRGVNEVEPILAEKCPICRLYGGPGFGGRLIIKDVVVWNPKTFIASRTSIERVSGKVREGALFSVEALVLPRIELTVIAEDVGRGSTEAKILAGVIDWLSKVGLVVGGMKSVGLGHYILDSKESKGCIIEYEGVSDDEVIEALVNPLAYASKHWVGIDELIKELRGESSS